ncbi:MAG: response regulator transcription factor [Syntrophales bacterium]|nr:response regulator transcription factor [Syntrophales bacterium]
MENILIIDDDRELCELLTEYLGSEEFQVESAHEGNSGIEKILGKTYSLVVLDVMLPGGRNGFEVLKYVRARSETPILMLTAKGEDIDRILGLEMGADDYLAKPFNPRELLARIRAILRRAAPQGANEVKRECGVMRLRVGDVEMDMGMRIVLRDGKRVELTSVEFDLLEVLLNHAGHVVSRDELAKEVLDRSLSPYDRSIDVHVSKLRKKLGHESCCMDMIKAIRGVGYLYVLPSPQSESPYEEGGDFKEKVHPNAAE